MGKKYPLHDFSQIPTFTEIAKMKAELESIRSKLPKWHRCDEPDEDGFVDLPPESGCYFAQYEMEIGNGNICEYGEHTYMEIHNCPMCWRKFGKD